VSTRYAREFPSAIAGLEDGPHDEHGGALLRKGARRSKVISHFSDEQSAMKLVFATRLRCEQRWNRISVSELKRRQFDQLRKRSVSVLRRRERTVYGVTEAHDLDSAQSP